MLYKMMSVITYMLYNLLYFYTLTKSELYRLCNPIYNHPYFKEMYKYATYIYYDFNVNILGYYVEYYDDYYCIVSKPYKKMMFCETFDFEKECVYLPKMSEKTLLIIKIDNLKMYKNVKIDSVIEKTHIVKNPFLSIEYKHKNLDSKIDIILEPYDFCDKNEILSTIFIENYFKEHNMHTSFSEGYEIIIIDNLLNSVKVKNDEYIELDDDGYTIKKL